MSFEKLLPSFGTGISILLLMACNSGSPGATSSQEKPAGDTAKSPEMTVAPASTDTLPVKKPEKCFENAGLKSKLTIKISQAGDAIMTGSVTCEEYESGKKETVPFSGQGDADNFTITFKGKAPLVGDASEWTNNKPWVIENNNGREILRIVFNAKNYDTNKWQETVYEFTPCR